jgi:hypothetical protein
VRDQSPKSPFFWRSDVAVQPDCQRRQQRRRQWEGFTYHDGKDSFRRQMIFAATQLDENHGALIAGWHSEAASASCQATVASEVIVFS